MPARPPQRQQQRLGQMESGAYDQLHTERRKVELRVFVPPGAHAAAAGHCRLAVRQKRKGTYWPFVWGFISSRCSPSSLNWCPYLPSYGGYVRYVVGIGVTALVGRYAILWAQPLPGAAKARRALPDQERRKELSYDVALALPGQERVPRLRASGGPERRQDRLLPPLRHWPV